MPAKDSVTLASTSDDVELRTVALQSPLNRTLVKDDAYTEEVVSTERGNVTVALKGDRSKPAIVTYHDLGLNYISNFQVGFQFFENQSYYNNFIFRPFSTTLTWPRSSSTFAFSISMHQDRKRELLHCQMPLTIPAWTTLPSRLVVSSISWFLN